MPLVKKYAFQGLDRVYLIKFRGLKDAHDNAMVFGAGKRPVTEGYLAEYYIRPDLLFGMVVMEVDIFLIEECEDFILMPLQALSEPVEYAFIGIWEAKIIKGPLKRASSLTIGFVPPLILVYII